jgi:hypothetical protein
VVGFVAMSTIISSAAMLRSSETLDALESAKGAGGPASIVSSRASTPPATMTAASSAAPAAPRALPSGSSEPITKEPPSTADSARPKSGGEAPTEASARAPNVELTAARAKGIPALEQLSHAYPRDPDVLKALLFAYARQRNQLAAMGAAERLLDSAPRAADDSEVQQAIMIVANGAPAASAEALRLLSTKMGGRGLDLLYDLLTAPRIGKLLKDRAAELLRNPDVRASATPALLIALDLRNAMPCGRKPLLGRAREDGDVRALAFLKPLTSTSGCGIFRKSDCFECLEPRKELYDTVAVIQNRLEQGAVPR